MKWTNQRIAAAAVLALAGAALLVDRFVLGYGPSSASANLLIAQHEPATPDSAPPATTAAPTPVQTISAADRVAHLADALMEPAATDAEDAFVIPAVWVKLVHAEKPKPEPIAAPPEEAPKFTLTSVLWNNEGTAIACTINGRIIKPGKTIAGYTLLGVEQEKSKLPVAVLEGPRGEVRVTQKSDNDRD